MAGYRQHLTFSGLCGAAYGGAACLSGVFTPVQAAIAGSLAGLAGMLPDLDSQTGKPVRELSGLVAAIAPFVAVRHLIDTVGSVDGVILAGGLIYVAVRYGGARLLAKLCVHRGMFHSVPALFIAALLAFLGYKSEDLRVRFLMGGGVALGFLSHLVLDEIYAVQWDGARVRLNKFSGSALKCFGTSLPANAFTYGVLFFLSYAALIRIGVMITPQEAFGPKPFVEADDPGPNVESPGSDETPKRTTAMPTGSAAVTPAPPAEPPVQTPLSPPPDLAPQVTDFGPAPPETPTATPPVEPVRPTRTTSANAPTQYRRRR